MTRTSEPKGRPAFWGVAAVAVLMAGAMFASVRSGQLKRADNEAQVGMGMQAYKDPVTGQITAPTPEQTAELLAKAKANAAARKGASRMGAAAAAEPVASEVAGGGVELALDDSALTYTVATRGPDGKLRLAHAQGPEQANAMVSDNARKAGQKEARNDR